MSPKPSKHSNGFDRDDRDLLVELRTEMTAVRADIKDLKDNTAPRLTVIEQTKLDRAEAARMHGEVTATHEDQEKRLRLLEQNQARILTWGSAAIVALGVIEFALNLWLKSR